MSLLQTTVAPELILIAQKIFDQQFAEDPKLHQEMDDRRKQLMFQDILYNFSFLTTAVKLEDEKIFANYAVWLYELLCNLMKDVDRDRIKDQMVAHYAILRRFTTELYSEDEAAFAGRCLDKAIEVTDQAVDNYPVSQRFLEGKHVPIRQEYLKALIRSDTAKAVEIITNAEESGIAIDELYEDILMAAMHEVGELWHQNRITIDKEHYCTSTTQMVLSMFYPKIFKSPRKGRKIVTCCLGSELHQMGGRMVSDLFELHGWDSVYLGAAVPIPSLLNAIEEHQPDLAALSVTMPQYLHTCREAVSALREKFPSLRIAVGGRAFTTSNEIYTRWPIDKYAATATELINWADKAGTLS
jgi:MerR family transcriptional regulator, light-induced transcriptional regulator